jgi:proline iminopeptidase
VAGGEPTPRPETRFWSLRTGSHIAYSAFAAEAGDVQRNPVVFLHGGPGRAVLDEDIAFFGTFTEEGFDVYLYDQVGSGLSSRLEDIEAYTVERHVRDLEAIRETIRADRLILIAHHAGAEIAARYMTRHRDRVERVVFYSPTPLWDDRSFAVEQTRTAAFPSEPLTLQDLRPSIALAIAVHSPRTAQRYLSQHEITAWSDRRIDERIMVCPGDADLAPQPRAPGFNRYAEVVGRVTADSPPDPRPALRQVLIPTVLLRGDCDPIDAERGPTV